MSTKWPVFPDNLSVSYEYDQNKMTDKYSECFSLKNLKICRNGKTKAKDRETLCSMLKIKQWLSYLDMEKSFASQLAVWYLPVDLL